ncbi:hypothetical protein Bbelb_298220 [Branchiostoma belcheri]|nr:hypothetical protein Bbelb_298220 [Branchiostoma belcheri]
MCAKGWMKTEEKALWLHPLWERLQTSLEAVAFSEAEVSAKTGENRGRTDRESFRLRSWDRPEERAAFTGGFGGIVPGICRDDRRPPPQLATGAGAQTGGDRGFMSSLLTEQ